jgi:hypothetical protein
MPVGGGASIQMGGMGTSGFGTGSSGGMMGVGPNGQSGTYTIDQEKVAKAQQNIVDADAKVAIQQQQIAELKADASQSQRMQADDELRRAKQDAADARTDLQKAQQGEFAESDSSAGGGAGGGEMGEAGSIMSQFMKDTFGLGDLFPDPSQLGIVKLLQGIMGIKYTPQGKGFPGQTGYAGGNGTPFSGNPFGGGMADPLGAATSMLPFGMGNIPNIIDPLQPGTTPPPPPMPAGQHGPGGSPGPGNVPQTVDQSTNVTVNGYSQTEVVNGVRRAAQWPQRGKTYELPGIGG